MNGGKLDEVEHFCYVGYLQNCEAGVERTIRTRVVAAWFKWRGVDSLLVNHSIPLKTRGGVYQACIRLVMYGAETWALTRK